ncbi:glutathione S-transferase family protein [Caulobacter mirabilis]|uniref:Glutathione S-transferase n=1 Tax=Caulobacter mirabilis TaxID=69666 RepID=A0A2D2B3J5_9CAUL|nr:glutathione S-transferase family protein [Caulobacter mirabilis]ATQ44801.1 glutathione S-transferase [Caulobacter mirabilis]
MITITAFRSVPPLAQGLVRDLRVRWALEEAGLTYRVNLITLADKNTAAHMALQPFGQVPVYEEAGLKLFESGAIVLHVAAKSDALRPTDPTGAARMTCWVLAALNSIETAVTDLAHIDLFHSGEAWTIERRPQAEAFLRLRLEQLSDWLGERDWLEDRFTAGDLMMATVLRILRHTTIVAEVPRLDAYLKRCEARPAFQRALNGQMSDFEPWAA